MSPRISTAWAMPSRWTFQISPIQRFIDRHRTGEEISIDPFAGLSTLATFRHDMAEDGLTAEAWLAKFSGVEVDLVFFDPPYSPRQISECYKSVGKNATGKDTQSGALYRRVKDLLRPMLRSGGKVLSFGWQSGGFGKDWPTNEILLVQHGGAHNDTICVAQTKP